jgi:hypothetical protein
VLWFVCALFAVAFVVVRFSLATHLLLLRQILLVLDPRVHVWVVAGPYVRVCHVLCYSGASS